MKTEISCGAVVFTHSSNGRDYVIIHALNGDYGFPKGHMEGNETEKQTAIREIKEETGLSVSILPGFREVDEYRLPDHPDVLKRVVFFVAEYKDQKITIQEEELESAELLPYGEAMRRLTFDSSREILRNAQEFIRRTEQ